MKTKPDKQPTPQEILENLNSLKHDIIKKNFDNAISRCSFANHNEPESEKLARMLFLFKMLSVEIIESRHYRELFKLSFELLEEKV